MTRRAKIFTAALLSSTMFFTVEAHAFPVIGFLGGLLASFGTITPLIGVGAIGAVNAGFAAGTFLASGFGSLLVTVGISAANYFLNRPKKPTSASSRVNVRIGEPERWLHAGRMRVGGAVMFGEYDYEGSFWFIIVHGDSELMNRVGVLGDEIPVTLDSNGYITTDEFTKDLHGGTTVFGIWTTTYSPTDPTPVFPSAEFLTFFPEWTSDHKLVGTTFSVVRIKKMPQEARFKVLTWRGVFGLGEPNFSIIADWSRIYDPRVAAGHDIDDPTTWTSSRNPELIWAWFRTHPNGMKKSMDSINWTKVGEQADICDQDVVDKNGGHHVRYQCGISIADSKERGDAEQEILLSADAVIMTDDEGKTYARVGAWAAPTLTLSAKRDIFTMPSRQAQDGETETDGVIVKYIDQDFGWVEQPCAPWKNPLHYQEGRIPRYLTVEILSCQDHNQAVRLAKAIGMRSQPAYRLAPSVGLRGWFAREEIILDLDYDAQFTGPHQIATPVELDDAGISWGFGLVPIDENRWTLLPGEEGDKPAPVVNVEFDDDLPDAEGVVVSAVSVPGAGSKSVRLEATFDAPEREDWRYEFQYKKDADVAYRPMVVVMDSLFAYSDTVENGETYEVQYRTVSVAGRASDWETAPDVIAIADLVAPGVPTLTSVNVTAGVATVTYSSPNSGNFKACRIWRAPNAGTFGTAIDISGPLYGPPNAVQTPYVDDDTLPVASGLYKYWVTAENDSLVSSAEAGPLTGTIYGTETGNLASTAVSTTIDNLGFLTIDATPSAHINTKEIKIYHQVGSGGTLNRIADLAFTIPAVPSTPIAQQHLGDNTATNLFLNPDAVADSADWTKGTGWAWLAGVYKKTAGTGSSLTQLLTLSGGDVLRYGALMASRTAGTTVQRTTTGPAGSTSTGSPGSASNNTYNIGVVTVTAGNDRFNFAAGSTFDGSLDQFRVYKQSGTSLASGSHTIWIEEFNWQNNAGTLVGPIVVTVI